MRTFAWFISDSASLYVRTHEDSGKVKRIKANKTVKAAPCGFDGKILGEWIDVEPSFVKGEEAERINKLFRLKYGIQVTMTSFLAILGRKRYVIIKLRQRHS
ncbi:MAG: hypothetical protein QXT39_06075 [Conexivisphaerales archaeon]